MNSRKKIINELRFQLDSKEVKDQHYPVQLSVSDTNAILALLKEQEPKMARVTWQTEGCKDGECPTCGHEIDTVMHPKYCGYCGQALKWEQKE